MRCHFAILILHAARCYNKFVQAISYIPSKQLIFLRNKFTCEKQAIKHLGRYRLAGFTLLCGGIFCRTFQVFVGSIPPSWLHSSLRRYIFPCLSSFCRLDTASLTSLFSAAVDSTVLFKSSSALYRLADLFILIGGKLFINSRLVYFW